MQEDLENRAEESKSEKKGPLGDMVCGGLLFGAAGSLAGAFSPLSIYDPTPIIVTGGCVVLGALIGLRDHYKKQE